MFIFICIALESCGFLKEPTFLFRSNTTQDSGVCSISERSRVDSVSTNHPPSLKYFKPSLVNGQFLDVKDQLEYELQSCDAQKMFRECRNLMASHTENIPLFSDEEYLLSLKRCNLAQTVLHKLAPFFTWSDHSVLTAIVKSFNNPAATKLLQQFDSQLDLSLPITEYPVPQPTPAMAPYNTSTQTVLGVRLNTELNKFSLQKVIELHCLIQKHFQITEHSLQLIAAKSSFAILYWMIPKSVSHLISSKIMEDSSLHDGKIQEVCVYPNTLFINASTLKLGSLSFLNQNNKTVS